MWQPRPAVLATMTGDMARSNRQAEFWRLVAYLSRYARQPWGSVAHMSLREMAMLADATNALVEEENKAAERGRKR